MADFIKTIEIAVPPPRVWQVMVDVERWHEWTRSITSIKRLDGGAFQVGSRAQVRQPKLLPAVWTVTAFQPGRSFTWMSRMPGLRVIGGHSVEAGKHGSIVTLSVQFEGLFRSIAARLFRKLNVEYLDMEASGLKLRCEAGASEVLQSDVRKSRSGDG